MATAKQLAAKGWNFSLGLAQLNRVHLSHNQITYDQAFDACTNLQIGSKILEQCYGRAMQQGLTPQAALRQAFSCYYSGNFWRGFQSEGANKPSYVQKVLASVTSKALPVVPALQTEADLKQLSDDRMDSKDLDMINRSSPDSRELPSDNTPLLVPPSRKEEGFPHLLMTDAHEESHKKDNNPLPLEKVEQHRTVLVF